MAIGLEDISGSYVHILVLVYNGGEINPTGLHIQQQGAVRLDHLQSWHWGLQVGGPASEGKSRCSALSCHSTTFSRITFKLMSSSIHLHIPNHVPVQHESSITSYTKVTYKRWNDVCVCMQNVW